MSVVIFSREIRTGKTTELIKWIDANKNVAGILMPDQDGCRMFYNIAEKTFFPAEADPLRKTGSLPVGSFVFDAAAFDQAIAVIKKAASSDALIIIDEIGKLELEDKGFSKILRELSDENHDLLIVVRTELLEAVKGKFGLGNARIISGMSDY